MWERARQLEDQILGVTPVLETKRANRWIGSFLSVSRLTCVHLWTPTPKNLANAGCGGDGVICSKPWLQFGECAHGSPQTSGPPLPEYRPGHLADQSAIATPGSRAR